MQVNLNGATPDPILSEKKSETIVPAPEVSQEQDTDKATLSSGQDHSATLVSQAMTTPDMRLDKIAALRQAIDSGQYQIEPDKIADAMLNDSAK